MGEARRTSDASRCICIANAKSDDRGTFVDRDPKCPVHGIGFAGQDSAPTPELESKGEPVALSREAAIPNHWNDKPLEPNSFRCPFCGAWRPPYGFNGQRATLPGMGIVDYITIYCVECKVLLQIQVLDINSGLAGGLPPGFDPRRRH